MPENPDEITAPMNLVNEFRLMSVFGVSSFWISVGLILGLFWKKFEK
jgi:predicted cobalt transporter CbtA